MDGARIGNLISRILKGVYNSQPPASGYSVTWDMDVMLTCVSNFPTNEDLAFQ